MIKRAMVSEKSMNLAKEGLYTFIVAGEASKAEIARLIKGRFNVDILWVRTVNLPGKKKSQKSRKGYFTTAPIKKAIVRVKKGQKIALFETGTKEKEVEVKTAEGEVVKEKKSLLKGTKVKIEKTAQPQAEAAAKDRKVSTKRARTRQQAGKTKGEKSLKTEG